MAYDLEFEMLLRLMLAAVLGGIIGAERERINRGAGLRTHAMVSTASALVMVVSTYGFMAVISPGRIVLDPSRVAAQVISGVGFLGAGIIIFRKNTVRNLTTAASIWAVAAIGLAAGAGLYISSIGATAILSFILIILKRLEKRVFPQRQVNRLTIQLSDAPGRTRQVADKLKLDDLKVLNMSVKHNKGQGKSIVKVEALAQEKTFVALLEDLQAMPGVNAVAYVGNALPINAYATADDDEEEQEESA